MNASASVIEIVDSEFVEDHGLELLAVELASMDDVDAHVVGMDYDRFGPSESAGETTIAAGEDRVVLLGVRVTGDATGSAAAVRLRSVTADGAMHSLDTGIAIEVVPHGQVCGG